MWRPVATKERQFRLSVIIRHFITVLKFNKNRRKIFGIHSSISDKKHLLGAHTSSKWTPGRIPHMNMFITRTHKARIKKALKQTGDYSAKDLYSFLATHVDRKKKTRINIIKNTTLFLVGLFWFWSNEFLSVWFITNKLETRNSKLEFFFSQFQLQNENQHVYPPLNTT